jgi:hypothetical protein
MSLASPPADSRPRILVVAGYYLPGYRAGGPVRTLANVVAALGDVVNFLILAADHDLGEAQTYPGVLSDEWTPVGKGKVMYLRHRSLRLWAWWRLLRSVQFDVIYLNWVTSSFRVVATDRDLGPVCSRMSYPVFISD